MKWYEEDNGFKRVRQDANFICWYCGVDTIELQQYGRGTSTVDHVIPRSRGGTDDESNLVCSCSVCNQEKADMTLEEYRSFKQERESRVTRCLLALEDAYSELQDERLLVLIMDLREQEEPYLFFGEKNS